MIEFVRWSIRLALVSFRDRVNLRERQLTYQYGVYGWRWRWLRDVMDRISPFDPWRGYRRRSLRSFIWKVTHPIVTSRLASLRWSLFVLDRIAAETGPGRYEAMDPATRLKVEWLDARTELASETTGESEGFGEWVAAFVDLDVPWSRLPENWLLSTGHMGFVHAGQYEDEDALWSEFSRTQGAYERWLLDAEPDDEQWTNREGQPEFNGAFG